MAEHSPLYVLLTEMRRRWEAKEYDGAVALARLAAPYLHGRAPSVRPAGELAGVPDEELEAWGVGGGEESAGEGPG